MSYFLFRCGTFPSHRPSSSIVRASLHQCRPVLTCSKECASSGQKIYDPQLWRWTNNACLYLSVLSYSCFKLVIISSWFSENWFFFPTSSHAVFKVKHSSRHIWIALIQTKCNAAIDKAFFLKCNLPLTSRKEMEKRGFMTLQFYQFYARLLLVILYSKPLAAAGEWRLDLRCENGIKPKRSCISQQINGHNQSPVPPSLLPDPLPYSISLLPNLLIYGISSFPPLMSSYPQM